MSTGGQKKISLKDVTLACFENRCVFDAKKILERTSGMIDFADVKLFSDKEHKDAIKIDKKIDSLRSYSEFIINDLPNLFDTEFVMIVQTDGFPINVSAWTDEYLNYDYIGAPWTWVPFDLREESCPTGSAVGNGGFSIRSKKISEKVLDYDYSLSQSDEDVYICREIGKDLKGEGIEFAPTELASYFSVENSIYNGQFGFHGKKTIEINKAQGVFN